MSLRTSDFHYFLNCLTDFFPNIAVNLQDGKSLIVKTDIPFISVGLMQSPNLVKNFFPLGEDSVFIHNEASLGCTQYGSVHFIFTASNFIFCVQENYDIEWFSSKAKNTDIIRIPPFPVLEKNKLNQDFFSNLMSQNSHIQKMSSNIKKSIQKIIEFKAKVSSLIRNSPQLGSKEVHTDYLDQCAQEAKFKIRQKVFSQAQIELQTTENDLLKLNLSTDESGIKINFQGTPIGKSISLTDMFTDGICFHFLSHFFQLAHKMNHATYSLFQVAKPTNSLVNSKSNTHDLKSEILGSSLILTALHYGVWKMYGKNQSLPRNYFDLNIQFKNENSYLKLRIPNGKTFQLQNMYGLEKTTALKNYSDGSALPDLTQLNQLSLNLISVSERIHATQKNQLSSCPGWNLKLKNHTQLSVILFGDMIQPHLNLMKIDKKLASYDFCTIDINHQAHLKAFDDLELKPGTEISLSSGNSPGYIENTPTKN